MSGNRPPDPPRYAFEASKVVKIAAELGMRVRFKPGAQGYGWVICRRCGWGWLEDEAGRANWLLDLSFYQREPWGCWPCRAEDRAAALEGEGRGPTT